MFKARDHENRSGGTPGTRIQTISYFILTVLGFSFWFFMVIPFASHRETYSWLAGAQTESFSQQFRYGVSSTYRPLSQIATRFAFLILNPGVFPTAVVRQALLQVLIYGMFVLAWWLIYSNAPQRRVFALVACITGGLFFSGYVHLFHIYGLFYVPVMLMLGTLLRLHASGRFEKYESWLATLAIVLALWHPFSTGMFLGFYGGRYLERFWQRSRAQHLRAALILGLGTAALVMLVFVFPRSHTSFNSKLFGFLVSYKTNEVNEVASFASYLLALMTFASMKMSKRTTRFAFLVVSVLSAVCFWKGLPLLFVWLCVALFKLIRLHAWSLLSLAFTAILLPFGGGIGSPMYALFAIIIGTYVTALGWFEAERSLSALKTQYVLGMVAAAAMVVLLVRAQVEVPVVTRVANPILAERERTYQLEHILAWLHTSDYCGYEVAFLDSAGSPIDDVASAINRHNRPPAAIEDVRLFWDSVLQCRPSGGRKDGTAIVTFGSPALPNSHQVFGVKGRYAGEAAVWIADSQAREVETNLGN
jgi:hypothetical protein